MRDQDPYPGPAAECVDFTEIRGEVAAVATADRDFGRIDPVPRSVVTQGPVRTVEDVDRVARLAPSRELLEERARLFVVVSGEISREREHREEGEEGGGCHDRNPHPLEKRNHESRPGGGGEDHRGP